MLRVSNLRGFNRVPQVRPGDPQTGVLSQSLSQVSGGWANYAVRQFTPAAAFSLPPQFIGWVRLLMLAGTNGLSLGSAWIGQKSTTPSGTDLNVDWVVPLRFGGKLTYAAAGSGTFGSDAVEFHWNRQGWIYTGFFFTPTPASAIQFDVPPNAAAGMYYFRGGADQAGQLKVTASEWTQGAGPNQQMLVNVIYMGPGS